MTFEDRDYPWCWRHHFKYRTNHRLMLARVAIVCHTFSTLHLPHADQEWAYYPWRACLLIEIHVITASIVFISLAGIVRVVALGLYLQISKWRRNYRIALSTGFPVFYSPWVGLHQIYYSDVNRMRPLAFTFLAYGGYCCVTYSQASYSVMDKPMVAVRASILLPRKNIWQAFNRTSQVWRIWKLGYEPFQEANSDTFILATPSGDMLWSSYNAIIRDLFT